METISDIQRKISEEIKLCGLTQTEIGKRLGVSQQTISHCVKGDKLPALDTFSNLCILLDVDPADILCVSENKKQ